MNFKRGDLIKFYRNDKKTYALILHVNKNKKTEKLDVYKILCNNEVTHTINWNLEKL